MLTEFKVSELLTGMAPKGQVPGGYATLAELLDGWRLHGKRLASVWAWTPPTMPTYTDTELAWRRQHAERLGFPMDGSAGPMPKWRMDRRCFAAQVVDFVRDHPDRLPELSRLWESLAGRPHDRRQAVRRVIFSQEP